MLFKIWKNCKGLRLKLAFLLALIVIEAVLAAFSISMILPITNAALGGAEDQSWITEYMPEFLKGQTKLLLGILAGVLLFQFFISLLSTTLSIYTTENLRLSWQLKLGRQYILQPLKFIANQRQGKIVNNLIQETDVACSFVFNYLSYASQIVIMLAIMALLFSVNWVWMSVTIAACILTWIIVGKPYFKYARFLGKRGIGLAQNLNSIMFETFNGIKDIKISNSEAFQIEKIKVLATENNKNKRMKKLAQMFPKFAKDLIMALVVIAIAIYMPTNIEELKAVMPQIALFLVAFTQIGNNISNITALRFKVMSRFPSFILITENMDTEANMAEDLTSGKKLVNFGEKLTIKNASFAYEPGNPVLKNLDIEINKGQVVCLLGPSGAGKTTLIDILTRLYDLDSGNISLGDGEANEYSLSSWRRLIGYVPQEPMMYFGSVRENITLGHDGINDDEIWQSCKIATIDDFIKSLPEGLDTMLTERGSNLSGGQKKRLALARAIAHKSQIIILDETTNAIQEKAEREIIENLRSNSDLTLIIISHRESTLELADVGYNISGGMVEKILDKDLN